MAYTLHNLLIEIHTHANVFSVKSLSPCDITMHAVVQMNFRSIQLLTDDFVLFIITFTLHYTTKNPDGLSFLFYVH